MTWLEVVLFVAASFCGGWLGAAVRARRDRARARRALLDTLLGPTPRVTAVKPQPPPVEQWRRPE